MHRRKRIRRSLMPTMTDMEVDGSGSSMAPIAPSKRDHGPTNIQSLTSQLEKITIRKISDDAKKLKRPKYIDTSKLLRFKR